MSQIRKFGRTAETWREEKRGRGRRRRREKEKEGRGRKKGGGERGGGTACNIDTMNIIFLF